MAPVLSFTAEEIWALVGKGESVFLELWHELPAQCGEADLLPRWTRLRELRALATKRLEELRVEGKIGSSLQGEVTYHADGGEYDLLAGLFKRTAIEEMLHIERLAERILFLKGEVDLKAAEDVKRIHDVREMLDMACAMEESSVSDYNRWANECANHADSVSKRLFESLVEDEERHYDQFDQEKENLSRFGDKYLALQSIERSKNISGGQGAD